MPCAAACTPNLSSNTALHGSYICCRFCDARSSVNGGSSQRYRPSSGRTCSCTGWMASGNCMVLSLQGLYKLFGLDLRPPLYLSRPTASAAAVGHQQCLLRQEQSVAVPKTRSIDYTPEQIQWYTCCLGLFYISDIKCFVCCYARLCVLSRAGQIHGHPYAAI